MVFNPLRNWLPARLNWFPALLGILSLAGLYATSRYNFLLFHCLTEAFSIVIAIAVFAVFWNTRHFLDGGVYLILGFGCLFAGLFDLLYIFAYPGMSVLPGADGNIAMQAKTVAQWYVSLSCVCAVPFLHRKIHEDLVLVVYSVIFAVALVSMFFWQVFPKCYVNGTGITLFERIGLVISCVAYLAALVLLVKSRRKFDTHVFRLLAAVLIVFFAEDLACAIATEMNGFLRSVAHLCQVVALYLVYRAFVEVGLTKPYRLLFRRQQQTTSALQRSVETLRQSEERYRRLFEAESDAILLVDSQSGRIVDANTSATNLYGYTRDECVSLRVSDVSAEPESTLQAIANRETQISLRRHRKKDGTVFPVEIAASHFNCQGREVHVAAIRDISKRVQAEETLRASEERYRLLVESIPQLAWRASADGMEVECNGRWYEYTGQTPEQVRAHGWLSVVHGDDLSRVTQDVLRVMSAREPCEIEYRLRRASDGVFRWHLTRMVPVIGEDGRVLCWVGSATDIEELKLAHEMMKLAHDEQLQRHQAELTHVARLSMIGEMAAGLAHELNQPLHAVKNYAFGSICRLKKMPQRDEELVVALEQIGEEANRAAEILRRVRAFVQKRETRFSEVFVNRLVEEAILFLRMELERSHTRIVSELAKELPAIVGDPIQIEQVVMNLLRNGLEAMDETPVANRLLRITTSWNGENAVQVNVCDSGKGISEEDREKVFEPFFTTKPEGMGMGLAISRSIVQVHGGRLWASVNERQGCTFHFALPVSRGSEAMAVPRSCAAPQPTA